MQSRTPAAQLIISLTRQLDALINDGAHRDDIKAARDALAAAKLRK